MQRVAIYKIILALFIVSLTVKSYSQNYLHIYSRASENDGYFLSKTTKYQDSVALFHELEKYSAKLQKKSYYLSGYDSIITEQTHTNAYLTKGETCLMNFEISNAPEKFQKRKIRNLDDVTTLQNDIIEHYTSRAYLFAQVKIDNINYNDNVIYGKIVADPGIQIQIDSVMVMGETKTKHYYIERALNLKQKSLLTTNKIDNINTRIENIAFLEQEQPYQLAFSDKGADVLLYLKKKKSSAFSGVLGIMPSSQTTKRLMITGDVTVALQDVFGIGENINIVWKKYETQNQNLNLSLCFPYIFKSPIGIASDFNLEKKDSSYIRTNFLAKVIVGDNQSNGFGIFYKNSRSFAIGKYDTDTSNNAEISTNLVGFTYNLYKTDYIRNPLKGLLLDISADIGQKNAEIPELNIQKLVHSNMMLDLSYYIKLYKTLTLKLRNRSEYIYSKHIFNNELIYVGGLKTIRGFDELSLPASMYSVFNCELRFLFERNSAVYALCDYMYFVKNNTGNDSRNHALGIGVGLDLNTTVGIFSIVYAMGKQNDNPFSISNSKIHFGYKNYF